MKILPSILVTTFFLLGSGCQNPHEKFTIEPRQNSYGLLLKDAHTLSVLLSVGDPATNVFKLFGLPDKTKGGIYGASTSHAWVGKEWIYVFPRGEPEDVLTILFQTETNGELTVNSWNWVP